VKNKESAVQKQQRQNAVIVENVAPKQSGNDNKQGWINSVELRCGWLRRREGTF
jgi:hypothetical protein